MLLLIILASEVTFLIVLTVLMLILLRSVLNGAVYLPAESANVRAIVMLLEIKPKEIRMRNAKQAIRPAGNEINVIQKNVHNFAGTQSHNSQVITGKPERGERKQHTEQTCRKRA